MVFMLEYSVIVLDHFRNAESTPQCIFNILHLNFNTSTINNIMVNSDSAIEAELTVQLTRYMMVCILV